MAPPRAVAACLLAVALLAGGAPAGAHGGPPLRIGATAAPDQEALGRLLLTHLRDGVGYAVAWESFADDAAQAAALAAGKVDVTLGCCAAAPPRLPELFPAPLLSGEPPCERLCVVVHPRTLGELRFTILGDEIRKLLGVLTPADVAAVRAARAAGGERAAAAAARAAVAGKRLK